MSANVKRSAVLKVPGVRPEQIPVLHALHSDSKRDIATRPAVFSAKFEPDRQTYTVEMMIPLEGVVNTDEYNSPKWVTGVSFAQEVFDALEIFPDKK